MLSESTALHGFHPDAGAVSLISFLVRCSEAGKKKMLVFSVNHLSKFAASSICSQFFFPVPRHLLRCNLLLGSALCNWPQQIQSSSQRRQKVPLGAFQGWLISVAWTDVQVVKIGKMNKSPSLQACWIAGVPDCDVQTDLAHKLELCFRFTFHPWMCISSSKPRAKIGVTPFFLTKSHGSLSA